MKEIYGLREGQFRRYVEMAQGMPGNPAENLLCLLESRLDNTIFRAGFAATRPQARQYASHGLFKLNGRRVDIPSIILNTDDSIEPRKKENFHPEELRKDVPWLEINSKEMTVRMKYFPKREEIDIPVDENIVLQFYSR